MKILITGGFGFIGSALARHFVNKTPNYQIVIVDDLSKGKKKFLKDIRNKFVFYKIDITNRSKMNKCFVKEKPDIVIHLAAMHFIPECNQNPAKTIATNVTGTYNAVTLANKHKVRQIIFASSASVYKPNNQKNTEDMLPRPSDIYGFSKLCGEHLIKCLCKTNWSILRFFNIIGPNETHMHLFPAIIKQLEEGNTLLLGNMKSKRDYLFVDDLARGISTTIDNKKAFSQILNFGSGMGTSVEDVVSEFETILQRQIKVIQNKKLQRHIDNPLLVASTQKTKELIGWQASYSLKESLKLIIAKSSIKD